MSARSTDGFAPELREPAASARRVGVKLPAIRGVRTLWFEHVGFGEQAVPYQQAWDLQRELHARRVADETDDVVLILEHPSVFTAGKRTEPQDRPVDDTPVVEVDRGGKITWHGPGQLVAYPITKLPAHVYVVDFVRRLEEALIRACADLGVTTGRVKGRSGVWLAADPDAPHRPERKIAALGVRVSRGVTMHGLALNCDNSMTGFDAIVPCGISDAGVTSLTAELGRPVTVGGALPFVERHLGDLLAWEPYDKSPDLLRPDVLPSSPSGSPVTYGLHP